MIIKSWNGEKVLGNDKNFIIIDQYNNMWRIDEDSAEAFTLMFVQTAIGATRRISVTPRASNVVDVGPAA